MLGLKKLRQLWQPALEPYEDEPDSHGACAECDLTGSDAIAQYHQSHDALAPLWQRPRFRVSTDQERAAYQASTRELVQRLSYDNPYRPAAQPQPVQPPPSAPEPPQRGFRLAAGPPASPGFWLCREYAWLPWTTTEVLRAADGTLWHGWGEGGLARPVAGSRLDWLVPALEGVPR